MAHIAIVGLGLIGGSLGLALRQAKAGYEIVGHDREPESAGQARKRGAVDKVEWNLPAAVRDAGLVIVAVPVDAVRGVFEVIAPHLSPGCVVTDTASVKREVMKWAAELLPAGVSFVGGHPMAGKETSGIESAASDLFIGRTYCLTPAPDADKEAINLVAELVTLVGAKPYFLDPAEHDSFAAAVSHLPFIAASTLVNTAAGDPAWKDAGQLAAGGFSDTTRVSSGDPAMYRAICRANRDSILRWLDGYTSRLATLRNLIAADGATDEQLEAVFQSAKEARDAWVRGPKRDESVSYPKPGEQVRQLLMGRLGEKRKK